MRTFYTDLLRKVSQESCKFYNLHGMAMINIEFYEKA